MIDTSEKDLETTIEQSLINRVTKVVNLKNIIKIFVSFLKMC